MKRPLSWFAFAFSTGIFLCQYLLGEAYQPLFAALFALVALLGFTQKERARRLRFLLTCFALAFAVCWNMGYAALTQTPARIYADMELAEGEALVMRYAEPLDSAGWGESVRCRIRVKLMTENGAHNAYLYAGEELAALEPGNMVRGTMAVTDAACIDDEEISTFTSKNVYLLLFPRGELTVEAGSAGALRYLPQRMAEKVEQAVKSLYNGEEAALVLALLTGDKGGFDDEMYSILAEAGILHIASVSGLHCMFLLSMIRLLLGKRRRLVVAVGVPLLLFYAFMVGAVPSVLRAVIMMLFLLAAPLVQRESDSLTSFSAALMLILLLNPFAAGSISLQLSFGAVAGMLWMTPKLYPFLAGETGGKLRRFFAASLSATAGALIFTVPLSAWYFNSLVLISPLANILCLTAVNLLFSLSLATVALFLLLPSVAAVLAVPGGWIAQYVLLVSRGLAAVPGHAVYFETPYIACWLGFAYLLLAIVALRKTGRREKLLACVSAALTLALSVVLTTSDYRYGEMNVVALDVGQGQSVIVTSGRETVLIDCGSSNNYISAGDVAGDMLLTMGGGRVDYLVLTHCHTDHTDGLPVLFARVTVEQLLMPRPEEDDLVGQAVLREAEEHDVNVIFVEEDMEFPFGEATLRLFSTVDGLDEKDENENGLSVLCTAGDFDFLVTGDMGRATEQALLEQKAIPDVELMMVGHHGSNGSSDEDFLAAVKPETAIISVGDNSYGHPAEGTLRRLSRYGVELYRTDLQGHVRVSVR